MPLPYNVLIAGLGPRIEEYLLPTFEAEGYRVTSCVGQGPVLETLNRSLDLVLLDLPGKDELGQLAGIREACPCALVVIGPARDDRLLIGALELGADDYVQRPFRTAELLARVRAQLRRRQRSSGVELHFGPLSLDPHGRYAAIAGAPLDLSVEEFALLALLAARPGHIYPAEFIVGQIWGQGRRDERAPLAAAVARLRALIEPDPARPAILGGDIERGFWLGGAARERQLNGQA
jgi:DNA-binding response OmpR family regulator